MKKLDTLTEMALLVGLAAWGMVACGQSGSGISGAGGSPGSGGKAGANTGTGGGQSTGGAVSGGSGGSASGVGGAKGSGGAQGLGGATVPGLGGNTTTDTGGTHGTGASAAGGMTGSGGVAGVGGSPSLGGSTGSGGSGGNAGVAGAGGGGKTGANTGGTAGDAGVGGASGGATGTAGSGGTSGSATCPAGAAKPSEGKKTVLVGSTSRTYYLHVPTKYDGTKPAPLVVDFHGLGGNGTSEAGSNPYKAVIDPEGVVSAYPDGANGTNGTGWNLGPCCTSTDDVAFAKALVQDVEKLACIDPKRVYAVGYSLGGGMVHVLACQAADVFAAASPAAADLVKDNVDSCKPARPITVFTFRGTADTSVPYDGGSIGSLTNIGATATFQKWAEINQCTGSPSAGDSNGCSTYSSCAGGIQVTLCTKQGGGHDPGNASVSWPVLKKYTLP
jgi:polyhydroxybutyrate depolymerase